MENQPKIIHKSYPKYRIWDEQEKKFYFSQGSTILVETEGKTLVSPYGIVVEKKVPDDYAKNLCEFTGILEATEKQTPIYSGDICLIDTKGKGVQKIVVTWMARAACWNISPALVQGFPIIIVGNIFEGEDEQEKPKFEVHTNINNIKANIEKVVN